MVLGGRKRFPFLSSPNLNLGTIGSGLISERYSELKFKVQMVPDPELELKLRNFAIW